MQLRNKIFLIYASKCLSGIFLTWVVSLFLSEWIDYPWSLISVVLVLSPEGKDAVDLAFMRIKANIVGCIAGAVILATRVPVPWNIPAGAVISLFICDRLNLNAGARSTLAAMIIVLLHKEGTHPWDSALSRVSAVATGCLLGLAITYIFHSVVRMDTPAENADALARSNEG